MRQEISEEWLKENGFERKLFGFAIGGGEDEDDIYIWQRGEIALTQFWGLPYWNICHIEELTYQNGFPSHTTVMWIDELIL